MGVMNLGLATADSFKIDQSKAGKRLALSAVIFAVVSTILVYAKMDPKGFDILWRYFAWANQTITVFAFAMITVYLINHKKPYAMALLPGMFYMMVVSSFILNAKIGFNLSWPISYAIAAVLTVLYAAFVFYCGKKTAHSVDIKNI